MEIATSSLKENFSCLQRLVFLTSSSYTICRVELAKYLVENPIGKLVPGAGAVFSNFDAVIPDLVFVRQERWEKIVENNRFVAAPDLVIEILSPGSENRRRNLEAKRRLYGKYGVQEYWVVDSIDQSIRFFRLQGGMLDEITTLTRDELIESLVLADLHIRISTIFSI